MDKRECIKGKSMRNVFRERIILEQLDNPFILNLNYVFHDEEYIYFVMDWARGGDLEYTLWRVGTFDKAIVKIFAAELASAMVSDF
jgi:serine/threonine protein kinase